MTIREIIGQGLYYARTCRTLWLFGFVVGITSSSGGGRGGGGGGISVGAGGVSISRVGDLSPRLISIIVIAVIVVAAATILMRFISEGALIEGVARARQGGTMTTREGFRAGWAHWGVLLRIALLYFAATAASLLVLGLPCAIAIRAIGLPGAIVLVVPALVIGVPWLVTLYLVQAFASRIAVLDNRHALDAIAKARLFLHGRLMHGLRLVVATLLGTFAIVLAAIAAVLPVALLLRVLGPYPWPVIVVAGLVLLPAIAVLIAMAGTLRSSIWTIGYVTEVES